MMLVCHQDHTETTGWIVVNLGGWGGGYLGDLNMFSTAGRLFLLLHTNQ